MAALSLNPPTKINTAGGHVATIYELEPDAPPDVIHGRIAAAVFDDDRVYEWDASGFCRNGSQEFNLDPEDPNFAALKARLLPRAGLDT